MLNLPHLKKIKSKFVLKKPTKNKIRIQIGKFSNPKSKSKSKKKIRIQCQNWSQDNLRKVNLNSKPKSKREFESKDGQNLQKKIPNPNSKPKSKFKVPAKDKNPKHRSAYKKENLKSELQKENPEAE